MQGDGQKGKLGHFQDTGHKVTPSQGGFLEIDLVPPGNYPMMWYGRIWDMVLPWGTKSP